MQCSRIDELLRDIGAQNKSYVVFNDIRKPHNNTYREIKAFFQENYKDIRKAKAELSSLVSFTRVFAEPLGGKAKKEILGLIKELNISLI